MRSVCSILIRVHPRLSAVTSLYLSSILSVTIRVIRGENSSHLFFAELFTPGDAHEAHVVSLSTTGAEFFDVADHAVHGLRRVD